MMDIFFKILGRLAQGISNASYQTLSLWPFWHKARPLPKSMEERLLK